MPAFVGHVQIASVSGGNVQFGDVLNISPKSNAKGNSGAGGENTGIFVVANSGVSATNHIDNNLIDQPNVGSI